VIDPVLLRENPDLIRHSQEARGESPDTVDAALSADAERRATITEYESLRAEQNAFGKRVASAPKEQKKELVAQAQQLAARVKDAQARASEAEQRFDDAVRRIGNVIIDGVPAGGEDDFVTLREVGDIPAFDFDPLDHLELGEKLDGTLLLSEGRRSAPRDRAHELRARQGARQRIRAAHHSHGRQARDHAGDRIPRRARR
jgi:seryl-tRNA synthetase